MEKTVDARGLSCPQPVVLTQQAINQGLDKFTVKVNSIVSKENVVRCATKNNYKTEVKGEGNDLSILVTK